LRAAKVRACIKVEEELEWNFDSSDALERLAFSGAQFGVGYRW
jgi:hypothetical protein